MYEQVQKRTKSSSTSSQQKRQTLPGLKRYPMQRQAEKAKEPQAAPAPIGGEETAEAVRKGVGASKILPGKLKFSTKAPFFKIGSNETQKVGAGTVIEKSTLANNEIVFSNYQIDESKGYIDTAGYIAECMDDMKSHLKKWHLSQISDSDIDIQLRSIFLSGEEKQAYILKWNKAWGQKPTSINFASSLMEIACAIEAKLSVTALHNLESWGQLDSKSQTILNNVFAGETNGLSKHIRQELKREYKHLFTQSAPEQEEMLRSFITDKKFVPSEFTDQIHSEKIGYSIGERIRKLKNYEFQDTTTDAEKWEIAFDDGPEFGVVIPAAPEPGYHQHTIQEVADAASYLTKKSRSETFHIVLEPIPSSEDQYWAAKYNKPNLKRMMSAGHGGFIHIFPVQGPLNSEDKKNYFRATLIHETGHNLSRLYWGDDTSKGKWLEWKASMDVDKISISGYATTDIEEDLAETWLAYSSTKGSPRFEEYRQIVPNRFAMLDKEF